MLCEDNYLDLFKSQGAILQGHFRLSSGLHSDTYIQCAKIFETPSVAEFLVKDLIKAYQNENIYGVIGPAIGGIIIAYEVARFLNCKAIFAEREGGKFTLRRNFHIEEGKSYIVAEDVITTGGSANEVAQLVEANGGIVHSYLALVNRSEKDTFKYPINYLIRLSIPTYEPTKCPLCQKNIPILTPGTRYHQQA